MGALPFTALSPSFHCLSSPFHRVFTVLPLAVRAADHHTHGGGGADRARAGQASLIHRAQPPGGATKSNSIAPLHQGQNPSPPCLPRRIPTSKLRIPAGTRRSSCSRRRASTWTECTSVCTPQSMQQMQNVLNNFGPDHLGLPPPQGHCNDSDDLEYLCAILERGCWIGLDRTGPGRPNK